MSIWNPERLTLSQMRDRDVREIEAKYCTEFVWPEEVIGDVVLLRFGYRAYIQNVSAGLAK